MIGRDFNSQPREGGWQTTSPACLRCSNFNSQPREGGWANLTGWNLSKTQFQLTAARRRLGFGVMCAGGIYYFNSQPREGGWREVGIRMWLLRHFNSQPREGGWAD